MIEKTNNHAPAVSIGMPVYNGEKYIRKALDSLLAQTFTDFELIISDNCSTDRTQEICTEYAIKDSRIRYIKQSENMGIVRNFDFVLQEAKAKYFMWAASDDFWSESWIKNLYYSVSEHNNVAAFGEVIVVNQLSQAVNHVTIGQTYNFGGQKLIRRLKFFLAAESMGKANIILGLYNTESLKNINMLKSNYSNSYDYILIFDLLNHVEIEAVPSIYIYKRLHDEAIGTQAIRINSYKRLLKVFLPVPLSLLKQYLLHSCFLEKILIIILIPIKFLFTYTALIKRLLISIHK